jgi:DNA processing protein
MPAYPPLLALLPDPPPALAVLGDVERLADRAVAVVGGRNASLNGQRIAGHLAAGLVDERITVVSGMARGIDAAAHEAVLAATGGRTVAAVAGGLDQPYPPQHAGLQAQIAARGAVVTEAPLGTEPQARHFPRRNRIIAGLSLGVLVAEAARHSGSLITARLALEAGREIFAVPGSPLDPRCQGSNDLIRQGAQLTETVADIMAHLPRGPEDFVSTQRTFERFDRLEEELAVSPYEVSEIRASVLQLLSPAPTSVDDLLRHCQFTSPAAFMAALLDLELGGIIESLPGNRVVLIAQQGG